jgi:hypothetical protein
MRVLNLIHHSCVFAPHFCAPGWSGRRGGDHCVRDVDFRDAIIIIVAVIIAFVIPAVFNIAAVLAVFVTVVVVVVIIIVTIVVVVIVVGIACTVVVMYIIHSCGQPRKGLSDIVTPVIVVRSGRAAMRGIGGGVRSSRVVVIIIIIGIIIIGRVVSRIVIIIDIVVEIGYFKTKTIRKGESFGHMLLTAKITDACDGIMGHRELSPAIAKKATPCHEGHEVMPALFITGRTKTDGPNRAREHVVGVFFMGLDIPAELEANMFPIIQMFAS